jgi:hypothetical protein
MPRVAHVGADFYAELRPSPVSQNFIRIIHYKRTPAATLATTR